MAELYKKQLGDLIRRSREELGLTQRDLAERIPVKESTTVSRWERGERAPNDLDAVARALETTASAMLGNLTPLHQKERRRLQPGKGTQLDRMEAKVDGLINLFATGQTGPQLTRAAQALARALEEGVQTQAEQGRRPGSAAGGGG